MSPIRKTVRATSASLYRPKKFMNPPPGYRVHDPEEWGTAEAEKVPAYGAARYC